MSMAIPVLLSGVLTVLFVTAVVTFSRGSMMFAKGLRRDADATGVWGGTVSPAALDFVLVGGAALGEAARQAIAVLKLQHLAPACVVAFSVEAAALCRKRDGDAPASGGGQCAVCAVCDNGGRA